MNYKYEKWFPKLLSFCHRRKLKVQDRLNSRRSLFHRKNAEQQFCWLNCTSLFDHLMLFKWINQKTWYRFWLCSNCRFDICKISVEKHPNLHNYVIVFQNHSCTVIELTKSTNNFKNLYSNVMIAIDIRTWDVLCFLLTIVENGAFCHTGISF